MTMMMVVGVGVMAINKRLDEEIMGYVHYRMLHSGKNNEIRSFATKWRNLENIMLSEISQSQRDKYMFSLIGDN